MSSIMQILRRIGGVKATPTSGSEGQLAMWKAGTAPTDATSLYAHDGVQWVELLDTSRNPRVIDVNDAVAGLRITQTGTGEALRVEDEANPDTTPFVVDTAGRVVIGGTAQVGYSGQSETLQVVGTGGVNSAVALKRYGADTNPPNVRGYKSRGATVGANAPVAAGDGLLQIGGYGFDGTQYSLASYVMCAADGAPRNGVVPGRVTINTSNSSGVFTSIVTVNSAGNVGICTDAPAAKLHIDKTGTETLLYVRDPAAPTNALFVVANNGHVGIGNNAGQYLLAVGTPDDQFTVDVVGYKVTATLGQPPSSGGGRATIEYDRSSGEVSFLNGNTAGPHHYLRVKGIGTLNFPTTYAVTGAGSALNITSGGDVVRSSSSIKYKKDVEPLDAALTDKAIRELRPVWYRTKNPSGDDKAEWSHIGLIAEEVAKVEPRLVNFKTVEVSSDDDGNPVVTPLETPEPEDVDYARLSVLLLDHVQRLEKRIAVLEARP